MQTSKRVLKEFLLFTYGAIKKQVLFEREVVELFYNFRKWHADTNWGKPPSGVSLKVFAGWLRKSDFVITTANNKQKPKF